MYTIGQLVKSRDIRRDPMAEIKRLEKALASTEAERDALKAEVDRLKKKVEAMLLEGVEFSMDKCEAIISGNKNLGLGIICHSIKDSLGDAPNFVTMTARPHGGPEMEVTIRRANGISPAEKIGQLESENARLTARVAELESVERLRRNLLEVSPLMDGTGTVQEEIDALRAYEAARDAAFKDLDKK